MSNETSPLPQHDFTEINRLNRLMDLELAKAITFDIDQTIRNLEKDNGQNRSSEKD